MNDYKELIEMLRDMSRAIIHDDSIELGIAEELITDVDADACNDAADVIEQLVKERDAAVEDMDTIVKTPAPICVVCSGAHCEMCLKSEYNSGFEWRGVQE